MKRTKVWVTAIIAVVAAGGVAVIGCCGLLGYIYWSARQPAALPYPAGDDLAKARSQFSTTLKIAGPAPQEYENESPPGGVKLVNYRSDELELKAWLSDDPRDGKRRPAVVYLHGGWAFGGTDWLDASPFLDAGFVLMMPMLRAENGNPGHFEHLYGEVDDAVAAGQYVSSLPYVDPDAVFVAGHSAGAMLTFLVAMVPSKYKAAAALSGYVDYERFIDSEWGQVMPYDMTNSEERRLRNPMEFAGSLRCPLYIFVEQQNPDVILVNRRFVNSANRLGKDCQLFVVPGDHWTMAKPAIEKTIPLFRSHQKP